MQTKDKSPACSDRLSTTHYLCFLFAAGIWLILETSAFNLLPLHNMKSFKSMVNSSLLVKHLQNHSPATPCSDEFFLLTSFPGPAIVSGCVKITGCFRCTAHASGPWNLFLTPTFYQFIFLVVRGFWLFWVFFWWELQEVENDSESD